MGCDIHAYVEQREGEGCPWEYAGELDIWRNYTLFAVLADVRNGWSFAGYDLGDAVVPISKPRGLPEDVTDVVKNESGGWGCDGHSYSYASFREILEYPWDSVIVKRGYVGESEFVKYLKEGKPNSYSGGVGGWSVVIITNEEMRILTDKEGDARNGYVKELCDKYNYNNETLLPQYPYAVNAVDCVNKPPSFYTQVQWMDMIINDISDSFFTLIDEALGDNDPDNIRLVFFFDN
jgi:hypothetical protein